MEREMLSYLDWKTNVTQEQILDLEVRSSSSTLHTGPCNRARSRTLKFDGEKEGSPSSLAFLLSSGPFLLNRTSLPPDSRKMLLRRKSPSPSPTLPPAIKPTRPPSSPLSSIRLKSRIRTPTPPLPTRLPPAHLTHLQPTPTRHNTPPTHRNRNRQQRQAPPRPHRRYPPQPPLPTNTLPLIHMPSLPMALPPHQHHPHRTQTHPLQTCLPIPPTRPPRPSPRAHPPQSTTKPRHRQTRPRSLSVSCVGSSTCRGMTTMEKGRIWTTRAMPGRWWRSSRRRRSCAG
jgi:hypothetical protein